MRKDADIFLASFQRDKFEKLIRSEEHIIAVDERGRVIAKARRKGAHWTQVCAQDIPATPKERTPEELARARAAAQAILSDLKNVPCPSGRDPFEWVEALEIVEEIGIDRIRRCYWSLSDAMFTAYKGLDALGEDEK